MEHKFNIRVYGLLINENQEILLSDEEQNGISFTKFPGGGLEFGEGLIDGLKREFIEECDMEIEVLSHFYTTHFFVESAFGGGQLLSIYYLVKPIGIFSLPTSNITHNYLYPYGDAKQAFRLLALNKITQNDVTFEIDKHVVSLLKTNHKDNII
ncbi:MAG: NUDIX domain-containing protein [Sphingobacteriales bacterium]|nr:MAG: NUDIX domain-containing protein [Sphingobacteriales bacterium]